MYILTTSALTDIYTLSLHDALPIYRDCQAAKGGPAQAQPEEEQGILVQAAGRTQAQDRQRKSSRAQYSLLFFGLSLDRKSTRLNSSHVAISYAVFCLKTKKSNTVSE